ncbi:DUF6573 family protein [Brevibacillus sp. NL20B1]|uniref:DUF6573 family protein n=1 Tax=Brevibacillus sp. NL20B1 TaxID=2829799 RepID=UPI001B9965F9|nr:DUF6573 family protein [Brevibacillus sp. NL20B1]MBR8660670.1 hypothetical protein [Brevibacillus sp. NL20B1]
MKLETFEDFQRAICEGRLVDVSDTAKEIGIRIPVAVSSALWKTYIEPEELITVGQTKNGRLWNVISLLLSTLKSGMKPFDDSTSLMVQYQVHFVTDGVLTMTSLRAIIRKAAEGQSFIQIMLEEEAERKQSNG